MGDYSSEEEHCLILLFWIFRSQKAGFQEGVEAGKAAGLAEGNKLGWEKGSAIGSEVQ